MKRLVDGFESAGAVLLFVVGAVMVVLGVAAAPPPAVATVLIVLGAALMSIAALLPRLEGRFSVGLQGFDGQLISAVKKEAAAKGLSAEETDSAVQAVRSDPDVWLTWLREAVVAAPDDRTRLSAPLRELAQRYVDQAAQNVDPRADEDKTL